MIKKNTLEVSFFFPVYKDESTVKIVAESAIKLFDKIAQKYEIIIVNDASPDRSGEIADELSQQYKQIKVIHFKKNEGYGATFLAATKIAQYEWLCMIDGDNEYDISDLKKMLELRQYYKLIIGFRYKKLYSTKRCFISFVYNTLLRFIFGTKFRDVSTGIRVLHRDVLQSFSLHSKSPFIGAEIAIKTHLSGLPVGEIGLQTFPRTFNSGSSTSIKNIIYTIIDMLSIYREIFSEHYLLPESRKRK